MYEYLGIILVVIDVVLPVLASVAVAARFWARHITKPKLSLDDWSALVALIFGWGMMVEGVIGFHNKVWEDDVATESLASWALHQKLLFVDVLFVNTIVFLTKLSLVWFLRRIFNVKSFRIAANIVIILLVLWYISQFVGCFLSRIPLHDYWSLKGPAWNEAGGINYEPWLLVESGIDMVFDLIVLCLPIPQILKLKVGLGRRLQVLLVFSLGVFCLVCSTIKFYFIYRLDTFDASGQRTSYMSYIYTENDIWAHVEAYVSIIVCCLPVLAPLVRGRTPESIIRSLRSIISLRSFRRGSADETYRRDSFESRKPSVGIAAPTKGLDGPTAFAEAHSVSNGSDSRHGSEEQSQIYIQNTFSTEVTQGDMSGHRV